MYLQHIELENVGPISSVNLELPFHSGQPVPVVLVGVNGSGKTTVLSFIVNALVAFKQQVFEDAEVESNKVFRVRSGLFLRGGANFYRAKLKFEDGLALEEWVLDRLRSAFEKDITLKPIDDGWKKVPEDDQYFFETIPATQPAPFGKRPEPKLAKLFGENVVLYFPSDRFEPPDWLNTRNLSADLQFPEPIVTKGATARRILSRSLLKPTLDWLQALLFDRFLTETQEVPVTHQEANSPPREMRALLINEG